MSNTWSIKPEYIVKDIIEFTPVRGKVAVMTLETV